MIRKSSMTSIVRVAAVAAAALLTAPAFADDDCDRDLEGPVESIDAEARSFAVAGVVLHTDERTDFDDNYTRFENMRVDDRVEVDFIVHEDRNLAIEVEKDD
jgi:Domain of unknown function (DUF5666)